MKEQTRQLLLELQTTATRLFTGPEGRTLTHNHPPPHDGPTRPDQHPDCPICGPTGARARFAAILHPDSNHEDCALCATRVGHATCRAGYHCGTCDYQGTPAGNFMGSRRPLPKDTDR